MKKDPAYQKIIITLKKYSEGNKISINRARYILSTVHRFDRPYNTMIIRRLSEECYIKLHGRNGLIEILI